MNRSLPLFLLILLPLQHALAEEEIEEAPRKRRYSVQRGFSPSEPEPSAGKSDAKKKGKTHYRYETTLLGSISTSSQTQQIADSEKTDLGSTTAYSFSTYWLFLMGKTFGIGPVFNIGRSAVKQIDSTGAEQVTTSLDWDLGGLAKYYFGNLDKDPTLFFIFGTARLGGESIRSPTASSSPFTFATSIGAGLNYFVDTNVAFSAALEYESKTGSEKNDTYKTVTRTNQFTFLKIGFTIFI